MATVFVERWSAQLRALSSSLSSPSIAPSSLPSLSTAAQSLSRELTEWAERIPAFELRRCEAELKLLTDALATASSTRNPKAKFSFKKRQGPAAASTSTLPPAAPPHQRSLAPPVPSSALKLSSPVPAYLTAADLPPASADSSALVVCDLNCSFVDLLDGGLGTVSALYLYDLKHSVVLIPPVEGSVMLHGCEDCLFVVGGHQFRMHASKRCRVFLHVASTPIIEACEALQFAPFPSLFAPASIERTPSSLQYATVQDFDHPFATTAAPSPNWRVLADDEDVWRDGWKTGEGRRTDWDELRKGAVQMV